MSSTFDAKGTSRDMVAAASMVSGATFVSRILGYVRDMIIARGFGAGSAADAFFVAFRIPNMARELLGEGALSAAFIPVFSGYLAKEREREAWHVASSVVNVLILSLVALSAVMWLAAPWLIPTLTPFRDPAQRELASQGRRTAGRAPACPSASGTSPAMSECPPFIA